MTHLQVQNIVAEAVKQVGIDASSACPVSMQTATIAAEHALTVAGAQFVSRMGNDLYMIQRLGRWGSGNGPLLPERTALQTKQCGQISHGWPTASCTVVFHVGRAVGSDGTNRQTAGA